VAIEASSPASIVPHKLSLFSLEFWSRSSQHPQYRTPCFDIKQTPEALIVAVDVRYGIKRTKGDFQQRGAAPIEDNQRRQPCRPVGRTTDAVSPAHQHEGG
jgi:hypothetical protein